MYLPVGGTTLQKLLVVLSGPGLFTLGLLSSSILFGVALGMIGTRSGGAGMINSVGGLLAIAIVGRSMVARPLRAPTGCWLVPRSWAAMGRPAFTLAFGAVLGVGFLTVIVSMEFYLVVAFAFGAGNVVGSALIVGAFGVGRALPAWVTTVRVLRTPPRGGRDVVRLVGSLTSAKSSAAMARFLLVSAVLGSFGARLSANAVL